MDMLGKGNMKMNKESLSGKTESLKLRTQWPQWGGNDFIDHNFFFFQMRLPFQSRSQMK